MDSSFYTVVQLGIKIFAVIGLLIYTAFAVIVVRQEQLMANVLREYSESFLRVLTLAHLFAAIGLLIMAIILL